LSQGDFLLVGPDFLRNMLNKVLLPSGALNQ
jgi:hypothetical protein